MLIHLLVSLCIGALCGSVASKIMNGKPKGFLRNALLGVLPVPALPVIKKLRPSRTNSSALSVYSS